MCEMRKYRLKQKLGRNLLKQSGCNFVLRKEELEVMAVTGKTEGKRAIGRERLTFILSLSHWMKTSEKEIIRTAKDGGL